MTAGVRSVVSALRRSQEELRFVVTPLTSKQLRGASFRQDRTIAQVMCQIGIGAEIGDLILTAALNGRPAPGRTLAAVRHVWQAKSPEQQVWDALRGDQALVERFEALDPDDVELMGEAYGPLGLDAASLIRMWLSEHAAHSWDVAVAVDPTATFDDEAVVELFDGLETLVGIAGVPTGRRMRLRVSTLAPDRELVLTADDTVQLARWDGVEPADEEEMPHLTLWAECFVRLVYGRLAPAHAPTSQAAGVHLDRVRALFPKFGPPIPQCVARRPGDGAAATAGRGPHASTMPPSRDV